MERPGRGGGKLHPRKARRGEIRGGRGSFPIGGRKAGLANQDTQGVTLGKNWLTSVAK